MAVYRSFRRRESLSVTPVRAFDQIRGANRRALAWVKENLGPLLARPATALAGPAIVNLGIGDAPIAGCQ